MVNFKWFSTRSFLVGAGTGGIFAGGGLLTGEINVFQIVVGIGLIATGILGIFGKK